MKTLKKNLKKMVVKAASKGVKVKTGVKGGPAEAA